MTYEPEQEVAAGVVFLPGGEQPPPVQQDLQGLSPPLQTELPDSSYLLPPLPVRTLEKVWELGFKMGEATACDGFSVWGQYDFPYRQQGISELEKHQIFTFG